MLTLLLVPAHELTIMASNCCCLCGERQKESLDETGEIIEFIGWSGAGCTGCAIPHPILNTFHKLSRFVLKI